MVSRRLIGHLVGPMTFVVIYAAGLAWIWPGTASEVENSDRYTREFRVLAIKRGATSKPEYVSYTLTQLRKPGTDLSHVSFLLPEKSVDIGGRDRHKATILESHPDWQLVSYHYAGTHFAESKYRAYKDRIEPVSIRTRDQPEFALKAAALLIPALIVAGAVRGTWQRATRGSQAEAAAQPRRTSVLVKALILLIIVTLAFALFWTLF